MPLDRAPSHRAPRDLLPLLALVVGAGGAAAAGLVLSFRWAGVVMALVLGGVAVARLVLPVADVGALAVRSRTVDATTAAVLAAGLIVLAVTAPA